MGGPKAALWVLTAEVPGACQRVGLAVGQARQARRSRYRLVVGRCFRLEDGY
ncbi:hypothetical protein B0O80DRAFT_451858 [Mortierella sp. GBAus27b]|nr:hypothetical protein B0O80DRAFT_451858 [Mortierella sp. GBAus27b]